MSTIKDAELRELFQCFIPPEPTTELVRKTKMRMHHELVGVTAAPSMSTTWVIVLAGLAIAMSLCLFYMFTVNTILQLVAPAWMVYYLQKSLMVFSALGATVIAGAVMTMIFKFVSKPVNVPEMGLAYNVISHNTIHTR